MPSREEAVVHAGPFQNHRFVSTVHVACFKPLGFQVVCYIGVDSRNSNIPLNDHTTTFVADFFFWDISFVTSILMLLLC